MADDKTQRVAYMKGFAAGHRKFEAEFETLLEVSEARQLKIDTLEKECKELKFELQTMHEDAAKVDI